MPTMESVQADNAKFSKDYRKYKKVLLRYDELFSMKANKAAVSVLQNDLDKNYMRKLDISQSLKASEDRLVAAEKEVKELSESVKMLNQNVKSQPYILMVIHQLKFL